MATKEQLHKNENRTIANFCPVTIQSQSIALLCRHVTQSSGRRLAVPYAYMALRDSAYPPGRTRVSYLQSEQKSCKASSELLLCWTQRIPQKEHGSTPCRTIEKPCKASSELLLHRTGSSMHKLKMRRWRRVSIQRKAL
jgi:hypothetical protein